MPRVFLAVGSNLGDRLHHLDLAKRHLQNKNKIIKSSVVYETDPVGGPSQGKYLNAVWEIETQLSPRELLDELLSIEKEMGRERSVPNAPRTIDLDILFYGDKIIEEPGLTVPHPRLHERAFVLKPMMNVAPDWKHPKINKTIRELWENLNEAN